MGRHRSSTIDLSVRLVTLVITAMTLAACGVTPSATHDLAGSATSGAQSRSSAAGPNTGSTTSAGNGSAGPQGGGRSSGTDGSTGGVRSGPTPAAPRSSASAAPPPRPQPGSPPAPGPRPGPGSTAVPAPGPPPRPPASSSSAGPAETTVVVAGPTLDDSYSEDFGSVLKGNDPSNPTPAPICVFYDPDPAASTVTTAAVAVDAPFVPVLDVHDCVDFGALQGPACRPGEELGIEPNYNGQDTRGCWFGVALGPRGTSTSNYEDHYGASLSFSVLCAAVDGGPCGDPAVTAQHPSSSAPVTVTVTVSTRLRYCGSTHYDDGHGTSTDDDPSATSAADGCT